MIKWTEEKILEEAKKYGTRGEFQKNTAYKAARRRNILDKVCSHMAKPRNLAFTNEKLQEEALKYSSRGEFQIKSTAAYQAAHKRKLLDKICTHMSPSLTAAYTYEELQAEALKYNSRGEFAKNSPSAYTVAHKRGLLNSACSHMPEHIDQSKENNPNFKWTDKMLSEEALKYNSIDGFRNAVQGAYNASHKRKILNDICSHMKMSRNSSKSEKELFDEILKLFPKTQKLRDRKVKIQNKPHIQGFDLDIYIPELRKGIEFDGKYWHSTEGLKRGRECWPLEDLQNYHQIKDEYFLSKGIKLLHIDEKDWLHNNKKCVEECLKFLENT